MQSLYKGLARGGSWRSLRWDEESPDYEAFRSAAIHSLSRFGLRALPIIRAMLETGNTQQQVTACWVLFEMFEDNIVAAEQVDSEVMVILSELVQKNPGSSIEFACQRLQKFQDRP